MYACLFYSFFVLTINVYISTTNSISNCFLCNYGTSNESCIPYYWLCDGYKDCEKGEDETNCVKWNAPFKCWDNTRILFKRVCDGYQDCRLGKDEQNCGEFYDYSDNDDDDDDIDDDSDDNGSDNDDDSGHNDDGHEEDDKYDDDNSFRCNDEEEIYLYKVCDSIDDCKGKEDEEDCGNFYKCYHSATLDKERLLQENVLNIRQIEQLEDIANGIKSVIDIQNGIIQISLFFVNIITSLFIIIGLYRYEKNIGFEQININFVVFIFICLQMILVATINLFNHPPIYCKIHIGSYYDYHTLSWFDVLQIIYSLITCYIWFVLFQKGRFKYGKYFIACLITILPIYGMAFKNYEAMRHRASFLSYKSIQILIPMIWCMMINRGYINLACTKCDFLCKNKCCKSILIWIVLFIVSVAIMSSAEAIVYKYLWEFDTCLSEGGITALYDPIYLLINAVLLFSDVRYVIILYQVIIGIIFASLWIAKDFCHHVLNIAYLSHTFLIPVYIILMFAAIKELKNWKIGILSMYLVSFDVVTDIVVIYYFIESTDYLFAVMSIIFIIVGQIFGSFSHSFFNDGIALARADKILSFTGFGRPWFLIKSWSEGHEMKTYRTLYYKHKIYELMFESFPTVTLQVYASLVNDYSLTIIISIVISSISIGFNAWMYLVNVSNLNTQSSTAKEIVQKGGKFDKVKDNKRLFFCLYGFLVSDFFTRAIPLIVLMASIPSDFWRIISFIFVFVALALFEFVMNTRMRIPKYQRFDFIIQIFAVSILSSFYNLLCTLDLLKNDGFFGKSVSFKDLMFEHKARICFSLFIVAINLWLYIVNGIAENVRASMLMLLYFIFLALNVYFVKMIPSTEVVIDMTNTLEISKPKTDGNDKDIELVTVCEEIKSCDIQTSTNYDDLDREESVP